MAAQRVMSSIAPTLLCPQSVTEAIRIHLSAYLFYMHWDICPEEDIHGVPYNKLPHVGWVEEKLKRLGFRGSDKVFYRAVNYTWGFSGWAKWNRTYTLLEKAKRKPIPWAKWSNRCYRLSLPEYYTPRWRFDPQRLPKEILEAPFDFLERLYETDGR